MTNELELTTGEVLAGAGTSRGARAFRALVEKHGFIALLVGYNLPGDTHWSNVIAQAVLWGDISSTGELQ